MSNIIMISGSYPPQVCGVGDYTKNIMETATANSWKLYYRRNWHTISVFRIAREINSLDPKTIFMQYPTQGYGWSIAPHLLCCYYSWFSKVRFSIVLHEFSQLSRKANLAARLLVFVANGIIFTNEFERTAATRISRSVRARSRTVRIVSNIPTAPAAAAGANSRPLDVAYFGHIRPKKGLETFIDAVREIRSNGSALKIALIGQCPPGFENYSRPLLSDCANFGVQLMLDMPSDSVAQALSRTKVVYLPFPDGVSERRGTALAAMANGALVLTTEGHHTTGELGNAVSLIALTATPAAAASRLHELVALPESERQERCNRALAHINRNVPQSWDDVARGYIDQH